MSFHDPSKSVITQAEIITSAFSKVVVQGECPHEYYAKGLRYAWFVTPCEFKECAVYSKENGLPGPPFIWNAPDDEPTN